MKRLFRQANLFLLRRPLPSPAGWSCWLTWFALVSQVPTLLVVGSGLVPALIGYWISRTRNTGPEKSSPDVSI